MVGSVRFCSNPVITVHTLTETTIELFFRPGTLWTPTTSHTQETLATLVVVDDSSIHHRRNTQATSRRRGDLVAQLRSFFARAIVVLQRAVV